jgi:hypothetical protein
VRGTPRTLLRRGSQESQVRVIGEDYVSISKAKGECFSRNAFGSAADCSIQRLRTSAPGLHAEAFLVKDVTAQRLIY